MIDKENMIDVLFYLGYITASVILITLSITVFYYGIMRLLNIKKVRFMFFRLILHKSIKDLNDNEFKSLLNELEKARY